ncbi:hypothetical protein [Peterkaempfera griseoplana]|uniref:hypothetical protein n=1 Tax=Peterkaempfera griseoplana TaxID=66896 RepID=UPI0006E3A5D3|nr:hypothetical protein [Peterkaempfera griseoplana]
MSVETQTAWLLQVAADLHLYDEQLFGIYCHRDPQIERLAETMEGLSRLQRVLIANASDEQPLAEDASPDDVAWRRCTLAYAYAGLLAGKALLRAHPALLAAVRIRQAPQWPHSTPDRITYVRSLSAAREVLQEGRWRIEEIASGMTGPEPEALKALTGEFAYKAVRSAAVSRPVKSPPVAEAAGTGAQVVTSPPAVRAAGAHR